MNRLQKLNAFLEILEEQKKALKETGLDSLEGFKNCVELIECGAKAQRNEIKRIKSNSFASCVLEGSKNQ